MSTPKRQHTVPRVYLSNFVDNDNRLTIYSKRRKNKLRPEPKDALIRSYYYSQPVEGVENVDHRIESGLLSNLETQYPALYGQLTSSNKVDLDLMIQTVSMMRCRSPAFREAFELGLADMVDGELQGIPSASLPKPPTTSPDIREHVVVTIDPHRSLAAMAHYLKEYCASITDSSFIVSSAPRGCEFLTSDNPVIWYERGSQSTNVSVYRNWATSRTRIVFPLDRKLALVDRLRRGKEPLLRPGVVQLSRAAMHQANEIQVACAWDYVVGTAKLPSRIWKKSIRVAPKMKIVSFDPETNKFDLAEITLGPIRAKYKYAIRPS